MNIIIPIGGVGQRFKDEGYDMPKPLINVLGKPMIYKVIDNLKIKNTDRIYIIYHNHLKEFNFETLIKFWFPNKNISFIPLDHLTRGASETVLRGLETFTFEELQENTLILDCDTFYNEDIISKYKSSDNKNVVFYFNDTTPTPIFSYITLKDNIVVDIKEKVKISNNANTGAYGFENGQVLKKYCSEVLNLGNELYISHVYNKMIIDGNTIQGNEIKDFIPQYVSPKRWKEGKYSEERQLPLFYKPKTLAGNITEGVSRFITGFYTPNKFLKGGIQVGRDR